MLYTAPQYLLFWCTSYHIPGQKNVEDTEALAEETANRIVGVKYHTDNGRIAVDERVNSSHPHMEIGLFVDYKMSPKFEWITPQELGERLDSSEWTIREEGN